MWKKLRRDKRVRNAMTAVAVVVSALLQTYVIQAFIKLQVFCQEDLRALQF